MRKAYLRIGIIAAAGLIGLLIYRHFTATWQFQEIVPDALYHTAVRSDTEFVNAATQTQCASVILACGSEEAEKYPLNRVQQYAYGNRLKFQQIIIEPGQLPTPGAIRFFLQRSQWHSWTPMLVASSDGVRSGMLIAAYRLSEMNMPLEQVNSLIDASNTPARAKPAIKQFAQRYANAMQATTQPATTQAVGSPSK